MDALHAMLRGMRGETKSRPDHLTVFREFLSHLERINRNAKRARPAKKARSATRRKSK